MRIAVAVLCILMALVTTVLLVLALWHDALQSLYPPIVLFALIGATCASYLRHARKTPRGK